MKTADALQAAIDYLGAAEVAPGRFAVKLGDSWHTFTESKLGERVRDGYTTTGNYTPMPAWWSPERRTIHRGNGHYIMTADLMTGEEMPV